MNRERFIRISGWALILGAITLMLTTIAANWLHFRPIRSLGLAALRISAMNLAVLGPLLLTIGMLGFLYRYGDEIGRLGKSALAIGAIGSFLATLGATRRLDLFNEVLGGTWIVLYEGPGWHISLDGFGILNLGGRLVLNLSLVVFGVTALIRKPLPRWNWLPILAGIVPVMIFADTVLQLPHGFSHLFPYLGGDQKAYTLGVSISSVILVLLGYILQTNTHRDSAIA